MQVDFIDSRQEGWNTSPSGDADILLVLTKKILYILRMPNDKEILGALSKIIDPDFNRDIVSLGFVQNLKINGGDVSFDIALTTPACPVKDEFQKQAETLIKGLSGVKNVSIKMTTLARKTAAGAQGAASTLKDVKSIIAVSSCKGGVGKSTMAAHLALELARRGFKVGLVDTDIHGPSVPALFDMHNVEIFANKNRHFIPVEFQNLKMMSFGFLLGESPAVMRGPMVTQYVNQILHGTAWGELDYLFIDMPPGTGDIQLTITQTVALSGAVIVTTRQTLSLVDVARGILMFEKVNVPILGIIENMSYFHCNNCDKKHYIFGGSEEQSLKDKFGLDILAEIPLLPQFTAKIEDTFANEFIMTAVDNTMRALGKSSILQKQIPEIKFDATYTFFKWPDGEEVKVKNRDLRLSCRCALCVNEMTGELILKEGHVAENIMPTACMPLGNYAIGINWNDNHTSGIYPYPTIRKLAEK